MQYLSQIQTNVTRVGLVTPHPCQVIIKQHGVANMYYANIVIAIVVLVVGFLEYRRGDWLNAAVDALIAAPVLSLIHI